MSSETTIGERTSDPPPSSDGSASPPAPSRRRQLVERIAGIGASAQAAIPGLYAWSVTVAPSAWSLGAPFASKVAASVGVLALLTAPLIESSGVSPTGAVVPRQRTGDAHAPSVRSPAVLGLVSRTSRRTWARAWSVWGFASSSAVVWALAPGALSAARLDGVRGAVGMLAWSLFAFASAGPALRSNLGERGRVVASTSLRPRGEMPRADGAHVVVGVLLALGLQGIGWGIVAPERAVLVRIVTVVCGVAVLGAASSVGLARHAVRAEASARLRARRALPALLALAALVVLAVVVGMAR